MGVSNEQIMILEEAVRIGLTPALTAQAMGIPVEDLERYIQRGMAGDPAYKVIAQVYAEEEAKGATQLLQTMITAAGRDWKAAAWLLERRYGYTREERHVIQQASADPVEESEVARALMDIVRKRGPREPQGAQ